MPAMILDELTARVPECAQIGTCRVESLRCLFLRLRESVGEILAMEAPVGLVENHVGEIAGRKAVDKRTFEELGGVGAGQPQAPGHGASLAAWRIAGKDRLASSVLHA